MLLLAKTTVNTKFNPVFRDKSQRKYWGLVAQGCNLKETGGWQAQGLPELQSKFKMNWVILMMDLNVKH